ncbi:disulfide bond formation protein B [Caldimonas tepidiphila]|uniref:disulfide bond formation protein B n=1 Tax=Caldimonas tepidiphila TaxID=2315841 RepID=UPI000E5B0437|nr:disulfide bond formation protein B [Caldimonas tepidiphila]
MNPTAPSFLSAPRLLGAAALLSLAAVGAALVTQHAFGMLPCPWCILQRLIFLLIAAVCGLALAWRAPLPRALLAGLGTLLALGGLAAALYQNRVASQSSSCALTLADRIVGALGLESAVPFVFRIEASCADAAVDLFGLPYEAWSGALYLLLALACSAAAVRALKR